MCDRPALFLLEPKSILLDLLKRTRELLDLSVHFIEYQRVNAVLTERPASSSSLRRSCRLNHTLRNDLDRYLHRLYRSCQLTKTHLRAIHALRLTRATDYIVLDDDVLQAVNFFQIKLNQIAKQFHSMDREKKLKTNDQPWIHRRYHSQRTVHHHPETKDSFMFLPETKLIVQNNNAMSSDDYRSIFHSFRRIVQFFRFLLEHFYGVHHIRDSHLLQPMFINIIRSLLLITNDWKERLFNPRPIQLKIDPPSTTMINSNHLTDEESLQFDADEFCRLANLPLEIEE